MEKANTVREGREASEINALGTRPPLYERIKKDLHRRISEGTFGPGDRLPSQRELCDYYDVSRITVQRAVLELAQEGFLYTAQGKGIFVPDMPEDAASGEKIRFVMAQDTFPGDLISRALGQFSEAAPGCRVEIVNLALSHRTREVVKGGLADLFAVREDELSGLMQENELLDLTEFVERDLDLAVFHSEPFLFCCRGSRLYAFPVMFSPVVMVYNRAHFLEAGLTYPKEWDWAQFLEYARKLTVRDDKRVQRYGFFLRGAPNRWPSFLLQNRGGVFDPQGNFILDGKRSLEALRFCRDLMVEHQVAPVGAPTERVRPFATGLASMFLETYHVGYYMREYKNLGFEWDMGPLPRGRIKTTLYVGLHMGIHRSCRYPELAWELLKHFISPTAQTILLAQRRGAPVLRSTLEQDYSSVWTEQQRALFYEEMAVARSIYWGADSTQVKTVVSDGLQMVWSGMETPEDACADIRRRMNLTNDCIRF